MRHEVEREIRKLISDSGQADAVISLLKAEEESEKSRLKERQMEGIASAQKAGVKFGRPKIPMSGEFYELVRQWEGKEITASQAAHRLGVSRRTYQNMVRRYKENQET